MPLKPLGKLVDIRPEEAADIESIRQVTQAAFATVPYSSQTESAIIDALRQANALTLSLVAVQNDHVVGHIAFSPVTINETNQGWYGLGPVSVHPDCQDKGIGGRLIREGLHRLIKLGTKGCVVLGEPGYYQRFGFEHDTALRYEEAPAEYFMRIVFDGPAPTGRVTYHVSFSAQ
jgi:putative acetyltransferase